MGRRTDNENQFRQSLSQDPELAERYLPVIDRIAEIQQGKKFSGLPSTTLDLESARIHACHLP